MLKNKLLLLSIYFLLLTGNEVFSQYASGDGTIGNPYQIATADQLEYLMVNSSDWNKHFIITTDINCNGHSWGIGLPKPIGNFSTAFTGTFDGQNHTISNIDYVMTGTDYVGFFGSIETNGGVSNLNLDGVNATGDQKNVGSFCGFNKGTISNCTTTGNASGSGGDSDNIGGFCGFNEGTISNCTTTGNASGSGNSSDNVGGFCGRNKNGTISNSSASGSAVGKYNVGGFCGWNRDGTISNSSATGSAVGTLNVGGFCGYNRDAEILDCLASGDAEGNVTNTDNIAGFCGFNEGGTISNCNSTGDASGNYTGNDNVGGFCGKNVGTISACSATGSASGTYNVGGFCGWNRSGQIKYSSTIGSASGRLNTGGFCGLNRAKISYCSAIDDADGDENVGSFCGNNDDRLNQCFSMGSVSGTINDGGFVGLNNSGVYNCCFWNETANPNLSDFGNSASDDPEVTSLSESGFANYVNFPCFDFANVWVMPENIIDGENPSGYPLLRNLINGNIIPTLTEWAVIIFIGLLAGVGGWFVWRKMI
jgi:hypothetical protein